MINTTHSAAALSAAVPVAIGAAFARLISRRRRLGLCGELPAARRRLAAERRLGRSRRGGERLGGGRGVARKALAAGEQQAAELGAQLVLRGSRARQRLCLRGEVGRKGGVGKGAGGGLLRGDK